MPQHKESKMYGGRRTAGGHPDQTCLPVKPPRLGVPSCLCCSLRLPRGPLPLAGFSEVLPSTHTAMEMPSYISLSSSLTEQLGLPSSWDTFPFACLLLCQTSIRLSKPKPLPPLPGRLPRCENISLPPLCSLLVAGVHHCTEHNALCHFCLGKCPVSPDIIVSWGSMWTPPIHCSTRHMNKDWSL